ncbi:putative trafficking protein particle complex subunit 13-like protein [Psilocybe cubensis]|uniref:Trafficking protein particle complex subunit 13-like protein n=2 Tax=Psilocybe cubensis TaxID=181762 RepID=A0ACB8H7M6_PSICU|nr:putative trafficking protein particle complex subunit 13-like protein [Psilocybe cubensis]KAH9483834.1 putative trafficking protein particle complex subunit 13-like protein [Psilocybe cubensis]
MATVDGPGHLLSLKVMRVSRPELASAWQPFYSNSPSFSAHSSAAILSLQGTKPLPGHPKTLRDLTHASELLTLPSSFGSIQLGETFSSCLCVNNETEVGIEVTQFKVEMQTVTSKVVLYEMDGLGQSLPGGDTLEHLVHHEIKELGQHVLACTVTYSLPPSYRPVPGASEESDPTLQTFRKFYKFAVTNPLSVKTKVHTPKSPSALLSDKEREKIFLEVHIQNLTQDAICFERMRLECTEEWEAVDGNVLTDENGHEESIFSGPTALMQPQDMRQYIYILTPKHIGITPPVHAPGSIIPLGRLDISWRSSFGEPGRLLTSMLSRRIPLIAAPQPASALPPYLKRTVVGSISSRPQSPSSSMSRPGSPVQRPGSPALNRGSISAIHPQSPPQALPPQGPLMPEIEAQLVVRHIPRESILIEKVFSISCAVVVSSGIPLNSSRLKRRVTLAIQHVRPKEVPPPVIAQPVEPFSPKVPSTGFSTPVSASTTFNYALAHQKILVASSKPPPQQPTALQEVDLSHNDANLLPPPYFEGGLDELKVSALSGVSFVGPSAIFLPSVEIDLSHAQIQGDDLAKGHVVQNFELPFVGLRKGFSNIGGIRILLVEDQIVDDEDDVGKSNSKLKRAQTLKEYDVIGEVWVSA